ncbi:MAG: radical SAM protein [Clostridiales bacterium]|nr:radical SAM protein [Clostridiales bacterium]
MRKKENIMLQYSKYNTIHRMEDHVVLYNALSQVILVVDNERELQDLQHELASDSPAQAFLLKHHFFVHPDIDETALARLYRLDAQMNNDLQIMILPTTACNFECVYCYETMEPCAMSRQTQQRVKQFFKRQVPNYRSVNVEWFGGEPLLMKDMIYDMSESIESICRQSGRKYQASITTNAYLLDVETFQNLLRHHVYTYSITLDGPAFIHDRLRPCRDGKGSFDKIIANLIDIKNKVEFRYFTMVIKVNVTRPLLDVFDEFLAYLSDIFEGDSRFTFMFRVVGDYGGEGIGQIKQELLGEPDVVYDHLLRSKITLDYRGHYALLANQICSAAKRNAYTIYTDGTIYKCASLLTEDRSRVGELGEHGEFLLDNARVSQWVGKQSDQGTCASCSFAPSCNDCPAKETMMNNERPCVMKNERLDKLLELLTRDRDSRMYGFVYQLSEGEIVQC